MIEEYKCKYIDCDAGEDRTFYFTASMNENPLLRAKEILADKDISYKNIILKIELGGDAS